MTRSAPRARTISTFPALQTPVTSAPYDLATCTVSVPTPPAAPLTKTFCPACMCPLSRRPCKGATARAEDRVACLEAGYAPATASTWPATSTPSRGSLGWRSPAMNADEIWRASHEVPIERVDGSCVDSDKDFAVFGRGFFGVGDLDDIRRD